MGYSSLKKKVSLRKDYIYCLLEKKSNIFESTSDFKNGLDYYILSVETYDRMINL